MERASIPVSILPHEENDSLTLEGHIRPMKRANVVRVPCSASNRSSKGVKASMFMKAWKKPAWTRGKVFVLYTGEKSHIS